MKQRILCLLLVSAGLIGCGGRKTVLEGTMGDKVVKTDDEWRSQLTPEQYRIMREKGTERAFTGKYWDEKRQGVYRCVGCGLPLFSSLAKYDASCGWPSFYDGIAPENIETRTDTSDDMVRTEAVCPRCGAHLGHVFDDGPKPTGLRYCINSASLDFLEGDEKKKK